MKKVLLLIVGFFCVQASQAFAQAHSLDDVFSYNGHEYKVVQGEWDTAKSSAEAFGGTLVSVNDGAEQTWLSSIFNPDNFPSAAKFWIGYHYTGNGWQWTDGSGSAYTDWYSVFPRQSSTASYAVMDWTSGVNGQWINWRADQASYGIAERVAPEPLSAGLFLVGGAALAVLRKKGRQ